MGILNTIIDAFVEPIRDGWEMCAATTDPRIILNCIYKEEVTDVPENVDLPEGAGLYRIPQDVFLSLDEDKLEAVMSQGYELRVLNGNEGEEAACYVVAYENGQYEPVSNFLGAEENQCDLVAHNCNLGTMLARQSTTAGGQVMAGTEFFDPRNREDEPEFVGFQISHQASDNWLFADPYNPVVFGVYEREDGGTAFLMIPPDMDPLILGAYRTSSTNSITDDVVWLQLPEDEATRTYARAGYIPDSIESMQTLSQAGYIAVSTDNGMEWVMPAEDHAMFNGAADCMWGPRYEDGEFAGCNAEPEGY